MLIKSVIFRCQNGLFHYFRHIANGYDGATFFAEFADQVTVSRVNPQGNLRSIVSQYLKGGEIRVGQRNNDGGNSYRDGDESGDGKEWVGKKSKQGWHWHRLCGESVSIIRCGNSPGIKVLYTVRACC